MRVSKRNSSCLLRRTCPQTPISSRHNKNPNPIKQILYIILISPKDQWTTVALIGHVSYHQSAFTWLFRTSPSQDHYPPKLLIVSHVVTLHFHAGKPSTLFFSVESRNSSKTLPFLFTISFSRNPKFSL